MTRSLMLITLLTAACGDPEPEHPAYTLDGDVSNGEAVYARTCQSCHAADGTGGDGSDLTETLPGMERDEVIEAVLDGIPGTTMVSYRSILTAQEIADVVSYIHVTWGS
ncbi:MAG: cytochrome c [Deltaproteobacteria bacterium]|nr:MAG: cytochrome c [Deltaproteobacteria bacterium]